MPSIYHGAATVISEGIEIPVEVALYTHATGEATRWSGSIRAAEKAKPLWAELEGDTAVIRLPDGREGQVLLQGAGFGPVQVTGEGPEPS